MYLRIVVLMLFCWCFTARSVPLMVLTEHLPPMQMVEKGKVVDGMATELVLAVFKQLDEKPKIMPYNWARAYKIATERENVLIFSLARYPTREKDFKWVGRIYSLSNYLWRLKSRTDIKIAAVDDAKRYRTATIRSDVQHLHLLKLGFNESHDLVLASTLDQALELMFRGRVDLFVASDTFMYEYIKTTKHSMDEIEPVIRVNTAVDSLYMAFSAKTEDKQVARFQQAYQSVVDSGEYQRIIEKWEKKLGVQKR